MIIGKYVKRFTEADMGMLQGASLNAPYKFHWVYIKDVEAGHIVCLGAGVEMRLPYRSTRQGDRAHVTVQDPVFGPIKFEVHPFKRSPDSPDRPPCARSVPCVEAAKSEGTLI
jgi:hypothetical protein